MDIFNISELSVCKHSLAKSLLTACRDLKLQFLHDELIKQEDVPLVEFMYLVFTGESYRKRLKSSLLYLCYVIRALINSLVC